MSDIVRRTLQKIARLMPGGKERNKESWTLSDPELTGIHYACDACCQGVHVILIISDYYDSIIKVHRFPAERAILLQNKYIEVSRFRV